MGYNPSDFRNKKNCPDNYLEINGTGLCPNHPVERISWNDTQEFIKRLNESNDGYAYRLPTEAEWEFAARGGTQTAYFFGELYDVLTLANYGWYEENSRGQSHREGSKKANQYNLYDMNGNVWEWVQDWYASYSTDSQRDPVGPASGSERIVRGGSGSTRGRDLRSAARNYGKPESHYSFVGFRLVRTPR